VVVPLTPRHDWDVVKGFSQAVVAHMARVIPQRFVAKSGPKNRKGRIFIDYLRNGLGATTVCAWSARARPGMGVSVPIAWGELAGLQSAAQWTVGQIADRLPTGNAPWDGYAAARQSLVKAMKALGFDARKVGEK
jgi:bifunctional non-homologous end joining protein LigD